MLYFSSADCSPVFHFRVMNVIIISYYGFLQYRFFIDRFLQKTKLKKADSELSSCFLR